MKKTWIWLVIIAVAILAYMNWDKIKAMMPKKNTVPPNAPGTDTDLISDISGTMDTSLLDDTIKYSAK